MIIQERKSKYKHKVTGFLSNKQAQEQIDWCTATFGPGGRSRRYRWRFGWLASRSTFYFKSGKDAMMFTLRWSDA